VRNFPRRIDDDTPGLTDDIFDIRLPNTYYPCVTRELIALSRKLLSSQVIHIPVVLLISLHTVLFLNNINLLDMTDAYAFSYPSPLEGYENLEPLTE
jgi:hypothetical protein